MCVSDEYGRYIMPGRPCTSWLDARVVPEVVTTRSSNSDYE